MSSPRISPAPKRKTALPTAASGPGCSAATASPKAETSAPPIYPRLPANSAALSTGPQLPPKSLFRRDAAARDLWQDRYPALSQLRPGLRGAATSRAEAQVLRLSAIYAALDSTSVIGLPHLQAALAVWDYCYSSASLLFGMSTGDPIADRIREAIEASNDGLSKYQIRRLFHGHVEGSRIDAALEKLVALGALYTRN